MRIDIAYDLRADFAVDAAGPEDWLDEYDSEETIEAISVALTKLGHQGIKMGGGRRFLGRVLSAVDIDMVFNTSEGSGTRSR